MLFENFKTVKRALEEVGPGIGMGFCTIVIDCPIRRTSIFRILILTNPKVTYMKNHREIWG